LITLFDEWVKEMLEIQNALHAERHFWRRTKLLYAHHVLWGNKIIDTVAVAAAIDPISVPNSLLTYLLVFKDCMQAYGKRCIMFLGYLVSPI